MGIYIYGVTFPQNFDYPLEIYINRYGEVEAYSADGKQLGKAIEVKEHGRLADIDELIEQDKKEFQYIMGFLEGIEDVESIVETHGAIQAVLNNAEIIIPEDRGKE